MQRLLAADGASLFGESRRTTSDPCSGPAGPLIGLLRPPEREALEFQIMASTYTSPYAASFKSALKRGTSYNAAVQNIANRKNTTPDKVWLSLFKADLCFRQKFNGQWIYFPCDAGKTNSTNWKNTQFNSWQWFTEWCIASGFATPEQFKKNCGSQKDFMNWSRKYFGKQFTWNTTTSNKTRKTTKSSTSKSRTSTKGKSYKFPTTKSKTRRVRRAA